MMMPMFGFVFTLLVIGGLGTLVAIGNPETSRVAPFVGFAALFAGIGALSLCLLFALIGKVVLHSETFGVLGFFGGYVVGGLSGAVFGLYRAFRRHLQLKSGCFE